METVARAGIAALVVALVATLAWGRARARRESFRPRVSRLPAGVFPEGPRAPLTAFYFTSRLCAECQETPRVVREAAPELPLVPLKVHERADLVRLLGVRETPTLLLVDAEGRIRYAQAGNPTPEELWTYAREAWDSLEMEGALGREPPAATA